MTSALDDFFSSYYRRRPVNASFAGIHDHDDRLPDFGDAGVADTLSEMETLRSRLAGSSVDVELARNFLNIQIAEYSGDHFHRRNPAVYSGEAIFGVLTSRERLNKVAGFLDSGRRNVREAPVAWTRRAIRECRGAVSILEKIPGAGEALRAFGAYWDYLETELLERSVDLYACGREFFDLLLAKGHMFDQSGEEILAFAEEELARHTSAKPVADKGTVSFDDYGACLDACRETIARHDLLTWPDHPIVFRPFPELVQEAVTDLYYLSYRSPTPFDPDPVHRCEVEPTGPITMKLNHVVHHGGPGHHVQNYYARRASSRIGRIAATDCAMRIAMFCGGTMAEGWACYATDLMEEFGFLSAEEQRSEQHTRLRMAARAIVDVRLHYGMMSFEQAVGFYRSRVGMSEAGATGEATRNSMFPGTAVMYLMGTSMIHDLRRKLEHRMSLKTFHDTFLSYGSIPVPLISKLMLSH